MTEWAASRSVSGLWMILSSLKRLRADMGGQLRITTLSAKRSSEWTSGNLAKSTMSAQTHYCFRRVLKFWYFVRCATN